MEEPSANVRIRSFIFSFYVPSFLMAAGLGMIAPIAPLLAQELGGSLAVTGFIVGLKGIAIMIFDLPAGFLVSRFGRKKIMAITAGVTFAAAVFAGLNRSLVALGIFNFFMGFVHSFWMLSRLSYIRQVVPARKRGRILSLMGGIMRVGTFLGPIAGGFLGKHWGLQSPFFFQAVLAAIAAGFLVRFVKPIASEPMNDSPFITQIGQVFKRHSRVFLTAGSAMIALGVIRSSRSILVPLWGQAIGLDVAAIGLIMGLSSAIDMTLFYPVGIIMDHQGRKWAALPCMLILSLSLSLMPLTGGFAGLLAVSLLAGLGNGMGSGINMTLGSDLAPRNGIGEFLGVWRLIGDVGTAAGPLLVGFIAQAVALGPAPLVVAGTGIVGALIMLFKVPETLPLKKVGVGRNGRSGAA